MIATAGTAFDPAAGGRALSSYGSPIAFLAVYALLGPISEEPGWRGYLYPRMRSQWGLARVGLLFGPVWAAWHLPLFLIPGTYQHSLGLLSVGGLDFLVETMGLTVIVSFAYDRAGLGAAMLAHFVANTLPSVLGIGGSVALTADAVGKVVVAVAFVLLSSRSRAGGAPATGAPSGERVLHV